jgi:hypothetical protein
MAQSAEAAARELAALGKRLKDMGANEHRKYLLKGIREGVKTAIPDVRKSAIDLLPGGGVGFDATVAASKFAVRTRLSGTYASVKIAGASGSLIEEVNRRGRLRHPVFGNRSTWVNQAIPAGWFDKPMEAQGPKIRREIDAVMEDVKNRLEAM